MDCMLLLMRWLIAIYSGKQFRQTIVLSRFVTPDMNALLGNTDLCCNVRGIVKVSPANIGELTQLSNSVPHVKQLLEYLTQNI